MDNVQCRGTESRLFDCTHLTSHNCIHAEDAGARCQGCRTGDIRLVGGSSPNEGRVEVCQTNVWGTVCDDFWGTPDATVVCRQLGFSAIGAIARTRAFFGAGTGNIFLDDVQCTGTEAALSDCQASSTHNCVHSEDAGVTCVAARKTLIFICIHSFASQILLERGKDCLAGYTNAFGVAKFHAHY